MSYAGDTDDYVRSLVRDKCQEALDEGNKRMADLRVIMAWKLCGLIDSEEEEDKTKRIIAGERLSDILVEE